MESSAINVVRLLAKGVKKLGVAHRRQEVKRVVRITDDDKKRGLLVADGVKLKLVVPGDFPDLGDIERREAGAAAYQNRFCGFSASQLSSIF
jgi:hypothetical protein